MNLNGILFHQIMLKKWTNFFLFLANVASSRSSSGAKEGALLVDSESFKVGSILSVAIFFRF